MDNQSVLIAQIQALQENLLRAEEFLTEDNWINKHLRHRVSTCFKGLFEQQRKSLEQTLKLIGKSSLDSSWKNFENIREKSLYLFDEYLAFIEGALLRSSGLDGGLCELADVLLEELGNSTDIYYPRFTILGKQEFLVNATKIIRLRFPEFTIWNLPIIAHEFGHFMNEQLRGEHQLNLFTEIINAENKKNLSKIDENHLCEQFADLVATYILGPAFACTCILLNFANDHIKATKKTTTHPSYAQRSYLMIETLKLLNKRDAQVYSIVIKQLETISNYQEKLSEEEKQLLNQRLQRIFFFLDKKISPAQYQKNKWLRAFKIASELQKNSNLSELVKPDDTILNILNAAWLARLQCWSNFEQEKYINQRALKLGQIIIDKKRISRK